MAKVWKQLLQPATYYASTSTGGRVPFAVSPADVAAYHGRLKDMLTDRLQVPAAWQHQEKAVPLTPDEWDVRRAELCKLTCGQTVGARLNPDSTLDVLLDVPDEEEARRVKVIDLVSPGFKRDFVDGRGKKWPGLSIAHVAITPTPVQHDQAPGEWLALGIEHDTIWLGAPDMADDPKKKKNPFGGEGADEGEGADGAMPPEDDGLEGAEGPADEITPDPAALGAETPPAPGGAAPAPAGESGDGNMDEARKVARICELLKAEFGMHISPTADLDSFVDHLETALLTSAAHQNGSGEDKDGDGNKDQEQGDDDMAQASNSPVTEATQPQILMALENEKASLQKENALLKADKLKAARQGLKARVRRLADHEVIKPYRAKQLDHQAGTIQLSLDAKFNLVPNELTYRLDELELTAPDKITGDVNLAFGDGKVTEVDHPSAVSEKDIDEAADEISGGKWSHYKAKMEKAK